MPENLFLTFSILKQIFFPPSHGHPCQLSFILALLSIENKNFFSPFTFFFAAIPRMTTGNNLCAGHIASSVSSSDKTSRILTHSTALQSYDHIFLDQSEALFDLAEEVVKNFKL